MEGASRCLTSRPLPHPGLSTEEEGAQWAPSRSLCAATPVRLPDFAVAPSGLPCSLELLLAAS